MQKMIRTALFAGTAMAAIAAGMPQEAAAQSITPGFFGSLEGWYYFSAGRNPEIFKGSSGFQNPVNHPKGGPGGKVHLGYRFDGPFDIALGVQGGWLRTRTTNVGFGTITNVKSKANYWAVDGEFGYNTMVSGLGVRLFAGPRLARFTHDNTLRGFTDGMGMVSEDFQDRFTGIGPRIGTDFSARIGSSNFSIFGDFAGSVLFGKERVKVSTSSPPCMVDCSDSASKSRTVWNVEGQLGVAYEIAPGINLGAGYRAEYWNHVALDLFGSGGHVDRFMHGPFARVSYNFGAPPAMPMAAIVAPPPGQPAMAKKNFIVFFDFDKSNITSEGQKTVNDAAATAKAGNAAQVTLTGHTDRSGSEQYNLALSLRRAEAVKAALIKQGVPASLIVVIGKGESQPLVPTADGVREPQNRRVEIVI